MSTLTDEQLSAIWIDDRTNNEKHDCVSYARAVIAADRALREWQPIITAPHSKRVLIHYKNSLGNSRIIKAKFVPRYTVESEHGDWANDEYCEERDEYYYIGGWYEIIDNWDELSAVYVTEGVPDMWYPLPVIEDAAKDVQS